jgi:hypothetical protein
MSNNIHRKATLVQSIGIVAGLAVSAVLMATFGQGRVLPVWNTQFAFLIGIYFGAVGIACAFLAKCITDRLWPESRIPPPSPWSKMTSTEKAINSGMWLAYVAFAILSISFGMAIWTWLVVLILAWIPMAIIGKRVERRAAKRPDSSGPSLPPAL